MPVMPPSDMPPAALAAAPRRAPRWSNWLLGEDRRQRVRTSRSLLAVLGYCVGAVLLQFAAHSAAYPVTALQAWFIGIWSLTGGLGFYGAIRSGLNLACRCDPALTHAQIVFGFTVVMMMYVVGGPSRGSVLIMLQLILVFGIFNLSAKHARLLSALGVTLMGVTMLVMTLSQPTRYPFDQELVHFALVATSLPIMAVLTGQIASLRERLKLQKNELRAAAAHNLHLAQHDALTQLYNRGFMQEQLTRYASHTPIPQLVLTLLDVDHFKRINDNHGHSTGDRVLVALARHMQQALPYPHVVARWGGEEFMVLSPMPHREQVSKSLEVLREAIKRRPLLPEDPTLQVTFSAGIASHRPDETLAQTLLRADQALYAAKADGRNALRIASRF